MQEMRLAAVVNRATEAIDNNLTLDDENSALFRLKRELVDILERHEQQATLLPGRGEIRARSNESETGRVFAFDYPRP